MSTDAACTFPACSTRATVRNRAGQATCLVHVVVHVTDSWINDAPKEDA